jgi:glycosyltransferase involved in cell wall biosynthesis
MLPSHESGSITCVALPKIEILPLFFKYFSEVFSLFCKRSLKMGRPITSFVIRTYNEEKWIGTVLQTLLDQTRKDFEIIIVDSGSTDSTLEIVKKFPVKLIQIPKEDFNFSYALNIGIKDAKSKYIGILSGHSVPTKKTWYEESIKLFNNSELAGITGNYYSLSDGSISEKLMGMRYKVKMKLGLVKRKEYSPNLSNTNSFIRTYGTFILLMRDFLKVAKIRIGRWKCFLEVII